MPNSTSAFLISSGVAAVIYLGSWALLRERADKWIGGAGLLAFVLSPWWAVLPGAVFGHVFAMIVVRKLASKGPSSQTLPYVAIAAFIVFFAGTAYNTHLVFTQAKAIANAANAAAWQEFAGRSEANRFVADIYRSCVEGRGLTGSLVVCRGSTVAVASARGQEFAQAVDKAILAWADTPTIDATARAKLDSLFKTL